MRKQDDLLPVVGSTPAQFSPPAKHEDFPDDPSSQKALNQAWATNVQAWTRQAIVGNPWNATNSSNQNFYYDPLVTPNLPAPSNALKVPWTALPNRINYYYGSLLSDEQQYEMADTGEVKGVDLPPIPQQSAVCDGELQPTAEYGPYGPRGWQDEYCEWAVTRDEKGNITRVDFTCENPEYWYTLWRVSPQRVCDLYRKTLDKPQIQLSDLYLLDPTTGEPVLEPDTGRYAYNPLNKWNSGTVSTPTSGGAMHLTSTPNNLGTEIALAGSATLQRKCGNADREKLLCWGQYGQPQRNSDPFIGQQANIAAETNRLALADPVGLYIQTPDWGVFELPDDPHLPKDAHVSECWQVVRGSQNLRGFDPSFNFILHAVFSIPQRWKDAGVAFTVSDITILGDPILYAAQITKHFQMALYPLPLPTNDRQTPLDRVVYLDVSDPNCRAQPLQLFYASVFKAYYDTRVSNPRHFPMSLASNTVLIPPQVARGSTVKMALTCYSVLTKSGNPTVEFLIPGESRADSAVKVQVTGTKPVNYAIPGNSYPLLDDNDSYTSVEFTLDIAPDAKPGIRDVRVTNADQSPTTPGPGFLFVL